MRVRYILSVLFSVAKRLYMSWKHVLFPFHITFADLKNVLGEDCSCSLPSRSLLWTCVVKEDETRNFICFLFTNDFRKFVMFGWYRAPNSPTSNLGAQMSTSPDHSVTEDLVCSIRFLCVLKYLNLPLSGCLAAKVQISNRAD